MVIRITTEQESLSNRAKDAIEDFIKEQASSGALSGNKLPSEEEFCQMLGISRPTVREALMALARDGIVSKKHGSGSLLHRSTLDARMRFDRFMNFRELLEDKGYAVDVRYSPFQPLEGETRELFAEAGTCCKGTVYIEYLYTADGVPAILAYNAPLCGMNDGGEQAIEGALGVFPIFLEILSGEKLMHTLVRFMADEARGKVAKRLQLAGGVPILKLVESHYSECDHLLAESVVYLNPNVVGVTILRKW